eukprot:TRINITY_DN30551_c0_g1_i1.p1 TRINITY_DN30551_c0_g1~~TRINITY_DN30551_c0_g1_i1.p1  ORF type:complete len:352 (+),score=116.82 TRINITY_DN30551_c0_g1_i1:94-1149(+)
MAPRAARALSLLTTDEACAKWLKEKHRHARWMRGEDALQEGALNVALRGVLDDVGAVRRHGCLGWHTYSAAVHLLCKLERTRYAYDLVREGEVRLRDPVPISVHTTLLKVHAKKGDMPGLLQAWRRLRADGAAWATDRRVYTVLLVGFAKAELGRDQVERLFRLACLHVKPDEVMVTVFMTALPYEAAEAVGAEFAEVASERARLRALLHICKATQDPVRAQRVFDALTPPCSVSWLHLVQAQRDVEALKEILPKMHKAGAWPPLPGVFVHCILHAATEREAEGLFQAAQAAGQGNMLVCTALLRVYQKSRNARAAKALMDLYPPVQYSRVGREMRAAADAQLVDRPLRAA